MHKNLFTSKFKIKLIARIKVNVKIKLNVKAIVNLMETGGQATKFSGNYPVSCPR